MSLQIRAALAADADAISEIYNYYVLRSTCTFQTEPETVASRKEWLLAHGERYPVIVAEGGGAILGWASLSKYNAREAYRYTAEDSVYVRRDAQGRGIGTALLGRLIEEGRALGYHSVIGIVAADQPASIVLHKKLGFAEVAHLKEVGFKFGRWIDVKFLQLML